MRAWVYVFPSADVLVLEGRPPRRFGYLFHRSGYSHALRVHVATQYALSQAAEGKIVLEADGLDRYLEARDRERPRADRYRAVVA